MKIGLPSEKELFRRLSLYGKLGLEDRKKIFCAARHNNNRLLKGSLLRMAGTDLIASEGLRERFRDASGSDISESNWIDKLLEIDRFLVKPGTHPLQRNYMLNIWLAKQGLCPLLQYAFDEWHQPDASNRNFSYDKMKDIAELSVAYLYRIAELTPQPTGNSLGTGSYNYILAHEASSVAKIPRNLAAKNFINLEEIKAYQAAIITRLGQYLTDIASYNDETGVIIKEFVPGRTAWDMLENDDFRASPYALDQLKDIYVSACSFYEKTGINLDIHPGNFCWSEHKQQWFLIDAGPMPQIGASYYPRTGFEEYFQKIWLDLRQLIIDVPIRSVDISISASATHDIKNDLS